MLYNILQIVAFQVLFLLVYDLLFRKETFFNYNRAYLLITSLLSFCLPFLKFPKLQSITTKDVVIQLPEVFIGTPSPSPLNVQVAEQAGILIEQPTVPIWQYIVGIGMLMAFLMFIFKLAKLYWMRNKNPKRWKGNILIVKLIRSSAAFSFFNTIFLGEQIPEDKKPTIYKHELVHIEEFHSLDLLYFELLRIAMWFNPLVYLYQSRIKELHEYIADAKAVKQSGKSSYYQTLLNQVFDVNNVSFTNTFFNKSLIKKRIAMLQKSKSKQIHLIKYAILFPLVVVMLIYTSTEVKAQEITEPSTELAQELTEEELIKKYYNEMVAMEKNGSTFLEIADFAGFGKNRASKYVHSKEEFLKSKAYMQYMADDMLRRKSEDGSLSNRDIDLAEKMKLRSTYTEHRAWLKTQEAKENWEGNADYDELRLVVNDLGAMTDKEKQTMHSLLKQVETSDSINKLIICDTKGASRLELSDPKNIKSTSGEIIEVYEDVEVPFSVIEEVPTTTGCKELATNEERKQCMSQFVAKHVNTNFNTGLADSLGIKGRQRIFVSFKIDETGLVTDIKARASHEVLEDEAVRVIKTLPQFIPGKHKGVTVAVPYALPIVFEIKNKVGVITTTNTNKSTDSLRKSVLQTEGYYPGNLRSTMELSKVQTAPTHIDCESIGDESERRRCTRNAVSKFVNSNFDLDIAKSLDLYGKTVRIFTKFTIDSLGRVTDINVRSERLELKSEAIRVLKLLPEFIPGEEDGEKVNVTYSLPIKFLLKE